MGTMIGTGATLAQGNIVAFELIGHNHPPHISVAHEFAQKFLGCVSISAALDHDFQHIAPAIDGAPEPMPLAADRDHDLIHMPFIGRLWPVTTDLGRHLRPETVHPGPDSLVADQYALHGAVIAAFGLVGQIWSAIIRPVTTLLCCR